MDAIQILTGSFKVTCSHCKHVNFLDLREKEKEILRDEFHTKTIDKSCSKCHKTIKILTIKEK